MAQDNNVDKGLYEAPKGMEEQPHAAKQCESQIRFQW